MDPIFKKIQTFQDGQTGANQGYKLLIEQNEVVRFDRLLPLLAPERNRPAPGPYIDGEKSLLLKAMPYLFGTLANKHGLDDLAGWFGVFTGKFHGL